VGRGKNEDDRVCWERNGVRKEVAGQIVMVVRNGLLYNHNNSGNYTLTRKK
jgi:hypothetical protein